MSRRQREPVHGFAKAHDDLIRGDFRALHVHQSLDDRVRNLFTNFRSTARFRQPTLRENKSKRDDASSSFIQCASLVFPCSLLLSLRRVVVVINQSIGIPPTVAFERVVAIIFVVTTYQAMCTNGIDARANVSTFCPQSREPPQTPTQTRTQTRTRTRERERTDDTDEE